MNRNGWHPTNLLLCNKQIHMGYGMMLFAQALREKNIPFELHIYPEGVHGLSLATEETANGRSDLVSPHVAGWIKLCKEWLRLQFEM